MPDTPDRRSPRIVRDANGLTLRKWANLRREGHDFGSDRRVRAHYQGDFPADMKLSVPWEQAEAVGLVRWVVEDIVDGSYLTLANERSFEKILAVLCMPPHPNKGRQGQLVLNEAVRRVAARSPEPNAAVRTLLDQADQKRRQAATLTTEADALEAAAKLLH